MQETFVRKVYAKQVKGKLLSAIQLTTAAGVCAMVDLMIAGKIPDRGLIRQEQVPLEMFLGNRFGRHYAVGEEGTDAACAAAATRRVA
jgi:saccharopine dehydrogenase-like NADP-dependent oxidoreductase